MQLFFIEHLQIAIQDWIFKKTDIHTIIRVAQ